MARRSTTKPAASAAQPATGEPEKAPEAGTDNTKAEKPAKAKPASAEPEFMYMGDCEAGVVETLGYSFPYGVAVQVDAKAAAKLAGNPAFERVE